MTPPNTYTSPPINVAEWSILGAGAIAVNRSLPFSPFSLSTYGVASIHSISQSSSVVGAAGESSGSAPATTTFPSESTSALLPPGCSVEVVPSSGAVLVSRSRALTDIIGAFLPAFTSAVRVASRRARAGWVPEPDGSGSRSAPPNRYAAPLGASTALAPVIFSIGGLGLGFGSRSGLGLFAELGFATVSWSSADRARRVDHDMVARSSTFGPPSSLRPFTFPCVTHISLAPFVHAQCPHRGTGTSPVVETAVHACIAVRSSRREGKSASSPCSATDSGARRSGGSASASASSSFSTPFSTPESIAAMPFAALEPWPFRVDVAAVPFAIDRSARAGSYGRSPALTASWYSRAQSAALDTRAPLRVSSIPAVITSHQCGFSISTVAT
mmetsp:Transcript_7207/g.29812  ORF Transcript_7207/g.29812 Transcript_7207/m.29812 type:complete len:386 (+) Transcript_7207:166-1323(+)